MIQLTNSDQVLGAAKMMAVMFSDNVTTIEPERRLDISVLAEPRGMFEIRFEWLNTVNYKEPTEGPFIRRIETRWDGRTSLKGFEILVTNCLNEITSTPLVIIPAIKGTDESQ